MASYFGKHIHVSIFGQSHSEAIGVAVDGLPAGEAVDLEQLLSVSWGNGVLYDADKDWADTLSMVEAGLLKPELALAKKYDLPCETPEDLAAIREKYMPEMVQLTAQAGLR